jgi:glycosyltransferase involved in cell wall biosynthesis
MHWGIDGQRLNGQRLGVGRYIEYLLKHWVVMMEGEDRVTVFVRGPVGETPCASSGRCEVRAVRPALTGHLWQNLVLPRAARDLDVMFGPSYSVPLWYRGARVVATHSVNEVQAGTHPWWYRHTYTRIYRESARRADAVIVPSRSTMDDVQGAYGIPAERIHVIPQGADEAYRPLDDEALLRATREKWLGSDRPYLLFVGKLSQRRNIPLLLRAFARVKEQERIPHALLLFGPNHLGIPLDQLVRDLGIEDSVVQTDGRVSSHLELVPVYNAAAAYINASLYEGFSMTLVEALSCGTPVVAANRGALGEIAGDAAYLIDEPDVDALAEGMRRVLGDPELAASLRRRALERACAFRWGDTARLTLDVLRAVARS